MAGNLSVSADIATSGMRVQAERLKVIAHNQVKEPEKVIRELARILDLSEEEVRKKVEKRSSREIIRTNVDKETGAEMVRVDKIVQDMSQFDKKYDPHHPGADAQGYVSLPNVNPLIEMMDMKEAQRAYEANMNMMKTARDMNSSALDILK